MRERPSMILSSRERTKIGASLRKEENGNKKKVEKKLYAKDIEEERAIPDTWRTSTREGSKTVELGSRRVQRLRWHT